MERKFTIPVAPPLEPSEGAKINYLILQLTKQRVPKEDIQFIITTASANKFKEEAFIHVDKVESIFGHRVEVFDTDVIHHVYGQAVHAIAVSDKRYYEELVKQMKGYELLIGGTKKVRREN